MWTLQPVAECACNCHCLCCCQQPAVLFVGDRFENDADFKLAKSMLLDMFRGKQVCTSTLGNRVSRNLEVP
jgi:hypothetical protein